LDFDADETLGQIKGDVDYNKIAKDVFLATDATRLMKEVGLQPPSSLDKNSA